MRLRPMMGSPESSLRRTTRACLQGVAHQSVTEESKEHLLVTQAHGQHTVQELGHLLVLLQNLKDRPVHRQSGPAHPTCGWKAPYATGNSEDRHGVDISQT
ncbi:MAG: hypothetical protein FRX49_10804 [Trebouxia sp. A1-2]|nr:MAG: hypothetical protein FRX49_10804 [Trebouxia sp. A1-2]